MFKWLMIAICSYFFADTLLDARDNYKLMQEAKDKHKSRHKKNLITSICFTVILLLMTLFIAFYIK